MNPPKITVDLVRAMIADQFPQWASLPIRPVATSGWDNRTFHLGDEMSVRLPSAAHYAAQVDKEQIWLPRLAPHLPLPIPVPIAMGQPSCGYPYRWSVMPWLAGTSANDAEETDKHAIAAQLAAFLRALHAAPVLGGPPPGAHNFYRGGDLKIYQDDVTRCINTLGDRVDAAQIRAIWDRAIATSWAAAPVWLHGDVAPGNFLIADNQLSAVIDFGGCGIGDPACDLTITWTYFDGPARAEFILHMGYDTDTWARAKGWGIWKALLRVCDDHAPIGVLVAYLSEF
ncbi:aminoglycoside phosphotransferase family protein [Yoonia sp. I 8.24]|uniref:aminoglycoside phosphotransferase family protein n=1 Tax=Yoonia sp. I 8.24 TaxID=1537229 RepID=UPI001EE0BDC4|nr:aminoglycoside phosphotransferase family protein [Yoonia sp. I 8.24]MCG3268897.1 aminoglycoside phosphotransferase family protein [Yoonia sp. I 8.24]